MRGEGSGGKAFCLCTFAAFYNPDVSCCIYLLVGLLGRASWWWRRLQFWSSCRGWPSRQVCRHRSCRARCTSRVLSLRHRRQPGQHGRASSELEHAVSPAAGYWSMTPSCKPHSPLHHHHHHQQHQQHQQHACVDVVPKHVMGPSSTLYLHYQLTVVHVIYQHRGRSVDKNIECVKLCNRH